MPTDNVVLNSGSGGATVRTLADASSNEWAASVVAYATTLSAGANVLQVVTSSFGLPVAQQGTWTVAIGAAIPAGTNVIGHVIVDSGAITANAGANLNTSALALETGGHLSSIDTKLPLLGQALAAASVPVVLTAAQIATLTPLTTVGVTGTFWQATQPVSIAAALPAGTNVLGHVIVDSGTVTTVSTVTAVTTVSTVSAVTAITNALPAGTNLLGAVSASNETGTIYNGTTALTPLFALISTSASGVSNVVAATGGKRIRVLRWSLSANGTVNVKFQSHVTPTDLTGLHYMVANATAGGSYCPLGIFQTISGEALDINLSAAVAVGGELTYVLV